MHLANRKLSALAQEQLTASARRLSGNGTGRTSIWDAHTAIIQTAHSVSLMTAFAREARNGTYYTRMGYEIYGRAAVARELSRGEG